MNSANGATAYIGRVGALAIALGVGAAVAGGSGIAWADNPTDSGNQGQQSSASSGGTSRASVANRRGTRAPAPDRTASQAPSTVPDSLVPDSAIPDSAPAPAAVAAPRGPARDSAKQSTSGNAPTVVKNDVPTVSAPAAAAAVALPSPAVATAVAPAAINQVDSPAADAVAQPAATAPPVAVTVAVVPAVTAPVLTAPVATPAPAAASQTTTGSVSLASRVLSAVGLAPLAGGTIPGSPVDSPALWALLGWTRREPGRTKAASAATALPSSTTTTALAVTQPSTLSSTPIGWVTGQRNIAYPGSGWNQTNNTRWANVYGTDLGIMWFNGDNQLTQLAFGDTFSGANMTGDWRSNVLLLSGDRQLNDGLSLLQTGPAYQFIPAAPSQVFFIGSEVTNIPTSAIYANNTNYVNYMSVKSWDTPGRWTTNYSAISQYDPKTDKWVLQKSTVRAAGWFRSSTTYRPGDQNFQQMAYVLEPESKVAPGDTQYVYAFGTPAGRAGSAYLSRVPQDSVTNLAKYEYWDGKAWVTNAAKAAPVIGDSTHSTGLFGPIIDLANDPNFLGGQLAGFTGAKTGGNVSEMSVQYNQYLNKYVALYGNGSNNVILRTADTPEGPWSAPVTIATSVQYPGLYAPMIHPLSGTGMLTDGTNPDVSNLYWNMSLWGNYNVVLMKTDLSALKATLV